MSSSQFTPHPANWTLRFKYAKSTLLLHVNPDRGFSDIKRHLLESLKALSTETQMMQSIGELPEDPTDIVFGAPVEKNRLEDGFIPLESEKMMDNDTEMSDSDKPSKKRRASAKLPDQIDSTPRAGGLRDGSVLAFTFKSQISSPEVLMTTDWGVEIPRADEDEELDGMEKD